LLFLAAKTLVTLSSKEKESLGIEAGPSALGMGVDSAFLEPGSYFTNSVLTCYFDFDSWTRPHYQLMHLLLFFIL
jgi:hypothetical protein